MARRPSMTDDRVVVGVTSVFVSESDGDSSAREWRRFLWLPVVLSAALLILPQSTFFLMSFHRDIGMGQVSDDFTIENYTNLLKDTFYLRAIWQTTYLSAAATLMAVVVAFPTAYWISRLKGWVATFLLSLVLASSLITIVIKLMGLYLILGPSGILNQGLISLGVVRSPIELLNNEVGVLIGLVHYTLPILVLLLFAVAQTIPANLEEAAQVHGATGTATFFQVIVPIAKQGILSGFLISFNMCMGAFTSPLILGGGRVLTVPILIQQKIMADSEYGIGAALSVILLVFVFLVNVAVSIYITRDTQRRARQSA